LHGTIRSDLGRLATEGWLAEQPEWFRALIAAAGQTRDFARGDRIDPAGAMNLGLCGVIDGCVDSLIPVAGERLVRGHRFRPGQWWGVVGLLAGRPALSETVAVEPARVFLAPAAAIERILEEHPTAWRRFAQLMHANVGITITLLGEALALPPTPRLARRLLQLSAGGEPVSATLDDLAELLGVTRSTVQRSLGDLVRAGAVEKRYRRVVVRDRAALERMGGDD
jgi:CRP-like cAMP-binding protein